MTISIKDRLFFQVIIGGKEVRFQESMLDYFHMVESVRTNVPMCSMRVKDTTRFFARNSILVDGATVQISIGVEGKKIVLPFRLFSHREVVDSGYSVFHLYCYLDVPRYWTESTVEVINGTASRVLQTLCTQSGMTFSGASTNDAQIWIPRNSKRAEFARRVVHRAWINDASCMQNCVTVDKEMRLVNLSEFNDMPVTQGFSNTESSSTSIITDFEVLNRSGFYNSMSGYKDAQVSQSTLKDDVIVTDLAVRKNSQRMMMNSQLRDGVAQNRVSYSPVDVGNVNENYERARYQNMRLGNLFSYGVEFVTPRLVRARPLDVITADMSRPGVQGVTPMSGKYIVTSKVLYIENMNFFQKIEAFRHGLNDARERTQY
jgi:hypothetical protein